MMGEIWSTGHQYYIYNLLRRTNFDANSICCTSKIAIWAGISEMRCRLSSFLSLFHVLEWYQSKPNIRRVRVILIQMQNPHEDWLEKNIAVGYGENIKCYELWPSKLNAPFKSFIVCMVMCRGHCLCTLFDISCPCEFCCRRIFPGVRCPIHFLISEVSAPPLLSVFFRRVWSFPAFIIEINILEMWTAKWTWL